MTRITIPPWPGGSRVVPAVLPAVWVDGRRRHDLAVERWQVAPGPQFGQLELVARDGAADDPASLPAVGARLRAVGEGDSFDGVVTARQVELGPDGLRVALEVRHALWQRLDRPVHGRLCRRDDGELLWRPEVALGFNGPGSLAHPATCAYGGRTLRTFALNDAEGGLWSVGEILAYLLAVHGPGDVAAPGRQALLALAGEVYPEPLPLTDRPLRQALATVAEQAGLRVRAAQGEQAGLGLEIYRPGQQGPRRRLFVQGVGRGGHGVGRAAVRLGSQAGAPPVVALGSATRYELTLELQGAWDPAAVPDRYRDCVRSQSADWPACQDVFRRWVLNETGRYSGAPWNLAPADLASVDAEAFALEHPRPLGPCLSTDAAGSAAGVVVEVSLDGGAAWTRYAGHVLLAERQCAVYLSDDALPGEVFAAGRAGTLRLRVTGTLTGDVPLRYEHPGSGEAPRTLRMPGLRREVVHATSVLGDGATRTVRDDTPRLAAWAACRARQVAACSASLTLPLPDLSLHLGDRIDPSGGQGLSLPGGAGSAACVTGIVHRFGQEWTTQLEITG